MLVLTCSRAADSKGSMASADDVVIDAYDGSERDESGDAMVARSTLVCVPPGWILWGAAPRH